MLYKINFPFCMIVHLLVLQWKPSNPRNDTVSSRVFVVEKECTILRDAYNTIQQQLRSLAGMDELLCGTVDLHVVNNQ